MAKTKSGGSKPADDFAEIFGSENDYPVKRSATPPTRRELAFASLGSVATVVVIFLLSLFGIMNVNFGQSNVGTTNASAQSGTVALTESELREEVKKISVPVYWAGPLEGALYTLENQSNARIFVRYLPDGVIPPTGEASKRIIGTYILQDAFESTKTAGTTVAGGIGLQNDDGAAIYYNSNNPLNVYWAVPGIDAQVEIFDPNTGVALQLATSSGVIQVIK